MIRKIKGIAFLSIIPMLFMTTSCKDVIVPEFENDINVYKNEDVVSSDITFSSNVRTSRGTEYDLIYTCTLSIQNNWNKKVKLNISNFTTYGNSMALEEPIYSKYNFLEGDYLVLDAVGIEIESKATVDLTIFEVIHEGNEEANFSTSFTLNNIKCNLFMYENGMDNKSFTYVHDPKYNETVLKDAKKDSSAVYGYVPSETGTLATYASYDWTDEDAVLGYKENRIEYIESGDKKIRNLELSLRNEEKSIEEIARSCSIQRNQNRFDSCGDDQEKIDKLKQRNLETYGNEFGPTPEYLYEKYGSWEIVLEKCYSKNRAMDAICGVYDMYFYMYYDMNY